MAGWMNQEQARKLLDAAEVFYEIDDTDDEEDQKFKHWLNMNDTFAWALAMGQPVADGQFVEVAELFWRYGHAGLIYWVSEQNDRMGSEFEDVQRFIDFVRHEEKLRVDVPDSNKRAYHKLKYRLGA